MILREALSTARNQQARNRNERDACEALAHACERHQQSRADEMPDQTAGAFDFCIGHDYLSEMIGNR